MARRSLDVHQGNPFDGLRHYLSPYRCANLPGLPPLGQLYGMWGYELIQWIEPTVAIHPQDDSSPPDGLWMLMDAILIFDQVKRLITAVAYGDLEWRLQCGEGLAIRSGTHRRPPWPHGCPATGGGSSPMEPER